MSIELTVCTPTFNRAHTLPKCYEAFCRQSCKDFIWLIVDDGSTDNTKELVQKWIEEKQILIQYIYQENGGKYRAVNKGIKSCKTTYFGVLDSDDYYCDSTVERFVNLLPRIKDDDKVAGIMARRGHDKNSPIGSQNLPQGVYISNYDTLIRKYHYHGDTCRAYKTAILQKYLYPEISDKFILESVILSKIDQKYDLLIVNEVFSISEYLEDGYTKNEKKLYNNNPLGYALGIGQITAAKRGVLRQIKYTIMFSVWCKIHCITKPNRIVANKALYYILLPISNACYKIKYPRWYFD